MEIHNLLDSFSFALLSAHNPIIDCLIRMKSRKLGLLSLTNSLDATAYLLVRGSVLPMLQHEDTRCCGEVKADTSGARRGNQDLKIRVLIEMLENLVSLSAADKQNLMQCSLSLLEMIAPPLFASCLALDFGRIIHTGISGAYFVIAGNSIVMLVSSICTYRMYTYMMCNSLNMRRVKMPEVLSWEL